jgi:diguanylate cyclase (GGDEF)-like protein
MPGPNDSFRSQSTAEESFFDLLGETLESLDRGVRGQFLAQFFKSLAHIELTDSESAAAWDRVLVRHRELSERMSRPVSLKTAMMDVLESLNLLHVPILVEYRELRRLQVSAGSDALTGLYNRRLFEEYFEKELSRAKRASQQLALVIMDLHRFKEVNDRHGHQLGDKALQLVAEAARDTVRVSDFTFRIGGDEFALLLPQCDLARCTLLSRRLRACYEAAVHDLHFEVPLTLDFGIAVFPSDGEQRDVLIRVADRRLYEMKNPALLPVELPRDGVPPQKAFGPFNTPRDKRRWERVSLAGTSAHIVWNEDYPTTVPVIDVSYGGVALRVEDPEVFPPAFQAMLHVPIQVPVKVTLRKSYAQSTTTGVGTRLGCTFISQGPTGQPVQ